MDLEALNSIDKATRVGRGELFRVGVALVFIICVMLYARAVGADAPNLIMLVVAATIGAYMALNVGANDVANNVGPAVGSQALTLTGAIVLAAIFEACGAIIAGGEVVDTVKKGIIDPAAIGDRDTFIWLMIAALLAAALWLNAATALGAPVSTTHSIVGGVLGAGVAAGGMEVADWGKFAQIVASWVISPVLGGAIAAGFLYLIKRTITYKSDVTAAARRQVPLLVGVMAWAFGTYLATKGLGKVVDISFAMALATGLVIGAAVFVVMTAFVRRASTSLEPGKAGVNTLFTTPLICSAAMLSFAHGANDVANAVGPLAAVNSAIMTGVIMEKATVPIWIMLVGGLGIAVGLALYGPKLIRTVGSEITELDRMRAFCVAMAAALTVLIASQLGLPVSSTHIAVGGVFGVGFLREYLKITYRRIIDDIERHHTGADRSTVEAFLERFERASFEEKGRMLKELKAGAAATPITKSERKDLKALHRHELVKRTAILKIVAAWVITVPASAIVAGIIFFTIRGMMLP
ncbi:MAG: inorganic phosphate transporter [Halofilum sp. (in: g-proteobacteria)]|nr:inorganic phosphate transporter [Halofilum sp. (in: g-proteobacteria)]